MPISGASTPWQSGDGSDGNEGVLQIPERSSIIGASQSECLISYSGHSLGVSHSGAEVQSVYSTVSGNWTEIKWNFVSSKILYYENRFYKVLLHPKILFN